MKAKLHQWIVRIATSAAALAVICAMNNVNSTCMFLSYQPDVPEGLL